MKNETNIQWNIAKMRVYPNPNTGLFQIDNLKPADNVEVFNVLGQHVNFQRQDQQIQLDERHTGNAFIVIRGESRGITTLQVSKQ